MEPPSCWFGKYISVLFFSIALHSIFNILEYRLDLKNTYRTQYLEFVNIFIFRQFVI
jgi:hypothetical protein